MRRQARAFAILPAPAGLIFHKTLSTWPFPSPESLTYTPQQISDRGITCPKRCYCKAFVAAKAITQEHARDWALAGLAPHLPASLLPEVLELSKMMVDEHARTLALVDLAPHLSASLSTQATLAFLATAEQHSRPNFLRILRSYAGTIARLFGTDVVLDLRRGIEDAAEWYP